MPTRTSVYLFAERSAKLQLRTPKASHSVRTEPILSDVDSGRPAIGFVELLFLISAFLAPLELKLLGSFTAYDFMIIALAFLISIGQDRFQFFPLNFVPAILLFLLFAIASTLRATHPLESVTQILQFVIIFFIQLPVILTLIRTPFLLRTSLLLFVCGTLIVTVWSYLFPQAQGAGRVMAFYSDSPNRLSYPTAYLLPFVLHYLFEHWRQKRALLATVFALPIFYLMVWALAASASRSAASGTLVGLMVFLIFRQGFRINLKTPLRIVSAMMVIGLLGYLLYQTDYFPATLRDRIARTLMLETSLVDDRRRLAVAGWRAFLDSPFLGVGLDNFRYVARQYLYSVTNQTPHNLWIQFLSQIGLIGTLMFFIIMIKWFMLMLQAQKIVNPALRDSHRELLWAFIAAMAAIMTIHMFLPIMIQRQYWLLYGLGLAIALGAREPPAQIIRDTQRTPIGVECL